MPFPVFSAPSSSYLFPLFFFQKATIHGEPKRVEHMGDTEIPYSIFFDFILTLSENSYRWVECISGKKKKIRRPINSPHPRKKVSILQQKSLIIAFLLPKGMKTSYSPKKGQSTRFWHLYHAIYMSRSVVELYWLSSSNGVVKVKLSLSLHISYSL